MKHLRKLLFPFSALYYTGIWLRNFFFDKGYFSSKSYSFPLICVGNLSTGGTGKTPMTEYLIRLLKDKTSLGVLSRGYGRTTKGFIKVNKAYDAIRVGDEPLQYATKFDTIQVAVCEDRMTGIKTLRDEQISPAVVLLDDAFQHRKVKAGFNILLTSYKEPFYDDWVLPVGNLRDLRKQAIRANAIVITKCPVLISEFEKKEIRSKVMKYSKSIVYFSVINYDQEVCGKHGAVAFSDFRDKEITLVTGIANPKPLLDFIDSKCFNYVHRQYRDHYNFTTKDVAYLEKCSCILTTEKDYMRLKSILRHDNLYYLPIAIRFLKDDAVVFDKAVTSFISD